VKLTFRIEPLVAQYLCQVGCITQYLAPPTQTIVFLRHPSFLLQAKETKSFEISLWNMCLVIFVPIIFVCFILYLASLIGPKLDWLRWQGILKFKLDFDFT